MADKWGQVIPVYKPANVTSILSCRDEQEICFPSSSTPNGRGCTYFGKRTGNKYADLPLTPLQRGIAQCLEIILDNTHMEYLSTYLVQPFLVNKGGLPRSGSRCCRFRWHSGGLS